MVFLELKPNNPAIHKSINPSSCGMTVRKCQIKQDNSPCWHNVHRAGKMKRKMPARMPAIRKYNSPYGKFKTYMGNGRIKEIMKYRQASDAVTGSVETSCANPSTQYEILFPDTKQLISVFVLTGQSNSLGTTEDPQESDITPGTDPLDARIPFFWANRFSPTTDANAPLVGGSDGKIVPLCAQQGRNGNTIVWGPEIAFGRGLATAGAPPFLIVKASRNGGGNSFWLKGATDDHMYRHAVRTVLQALGALPPTTKFNIAALLYVQGESDKEDEAAAAGERLQKLAENLRKELPHATNMIVLVGGIAAPGTCRDIVRAKQAALPATDSSFLYIDTIDLQPLLYDNLHFNKSAKFEVGRRMCATWLKRNRMALS
jgi:hypothetical protein